MRKDMKKVIAERGSVGGTGNFMIRRNRRQIKQACENLSEDADALNFHAIKKVHTASTCSWGNLKDSAYSSNVIRRYLKSQVGRPWNDVYSDMSKNLDRRGLDNVAWMVETKTYFEDGKIWVAGIPPTVLGLSYRRDEFYVDPRDGTLRCMPHAPGGKKYADRRKEILDKSRYIDPKNLLVQYHCIDGIWYEIKLREASASEKKENSFGEYRRNYNRATFMLETEWCRIYNNAIVNQLVDNNKKVFVFERDNIWELCSTLFCGNYLPLSKRQISSKEIRRIKGLMEERDKE